MSKPTQPAVGVCSGCNMEAILFYKFKRHLCEWCILVIASKYTHLLQHCGWCEDQVLLDHKCDEEKSVDWLDFISKLK